jgi:putative intracellular protease/amidase
MTKIVTILTEGFADWETTLLNAVAHTFYKIDTKYATPGGKPVTSSGALRVTPDMAAEDVRPEEFDAVIVSGGTAWKSDAAPDISALLRTAKDKGVLLGLICDATWAAAKAGILDDIRHTSNGAGYLDGTGYAGKALYRDTAAAVTDGRIITAAGTSPVAFMGAVMDGLGLGDDNLQYYLGLHAAQFKAAA